jgi:DNA-binding NtrC family response regulator/predicted TIM-barrel enzyme
VTNPPSRRLFTNSRKGPVIGAIVDTGQLAKMASAGGADFLMALHVAPFRQRGASALGAFLPFGNANQSTERLVAEHLANLSVPLVAGLVAEDPTADLGERFLRFLDLGVAGVTNYPTVTLTDGSLRTIYEENGVTVEAECQLLRAALDAGLSAIGFVGGDAREAARFAELPLDCLVISAGLTREISDAVDRRDRLEQSATLIRQVVASVKRVRPGLPCLLFGGPVTSAEDFELFLRQVEIDGLVGGSIFSRIPVEKAVTSAVRRFKGARVTRDESAFGALIGASPAMLALYRLIERAADCDFNVCLEGESGTGKELVATQLHRLSRRQNGPLVTLNCGAIPEALLESELFGHERGAFTGAERRRLGKFELADGGTLFLDEVADLSPRAQVALLRAIQQREITRVGGDVPREVDCRIVCATNQPLAQLVRDGVFRADLFYRLNELTIHIPPLRERTADIPLLVEPILASLRAQRSHSSWEVAPEFLDKLSRHAWPGNVRELQHVLYQAAFLEEGPLLLGSHFEPQAAAAAENQPSASRSVDASTAAESLDGPPELWAATQRKQRAMAALRNASGNKSRAAEQLGISRKTLYAWLRGVEN